MTDLKFALHQLLKNKNLADVGSVCMVDLRLGATRLLAALTAGDQAGGQRTGRESAALLVRTRDGFPLDIVLRVDHADDPVGQLRFLYDLQTARQDVIQAGRIAGRGLIDASRKLLISAMVRAATWPRLCVDTAKVAIRIEGPDLALQYLTLAFSQNTARIPAAIGDGYFPELGARPEFHQWVGRDVEQQALHAAHGVSDTDRPADVRRLLEAGHVAEALALLENGGHLSASPDAALIRAAAESESGRRTAAIATCEAALKSFPGSVEVCLNLRGGGLVQAGTRTLELEEYTSAFYVRGDESIAASRTKGEPHQFLTLELSFDFLRQLLSGQKSGLHPLVLKVVLGDSRINGAEQAIQSRRGRRSC